MYANGFLPSVYQPSLFRAGKKPVLNLELPAEVSLDQRKKTLGLIRELDQARMTPDDEEFSARMNAYDLAFKMQTEAPAVFDISKEPPRCRIYTEWVTRSRTTTAGAASWPGGW